MSRPVTLRGRRSCADSGAISDLHDARRPHQAADCGNEEDAEDEEAAVSSTPVQTDRVQCCDPVTEAGGETKTVRHPFHGP